LREGRYPITEIGILPLTKELVKHAEQAMNVEGAKTQLYRNATIDGRPTLALAVTHDQPHEDLTYHHARVFIDREWNVPVRYEAYGFPSEPGGPPRLQEQYTYLDVAFNVGLTDDDFDLRNSEYSFPIPKSLESHADHPQPETESTEDETPDAPSPAPPVTIAADFAAHTAAARERLDSSPTYTSLVIRRREIDGQLSQGEFHRLKFRARPRSVYLRGLYPESVQQQRLLYVANQNGGNTVVRLSGTTGGERLSTADLRRRINDARPVSEFGIESLLRAAEASASGEKTTVRRYPNAKVDSRSCVCFEITHRPTDDSTRAHRRRVFFDKQSRLPIRFETYLLAATGSAPARLLEAITYRNVYLDASLTARDFDALNPAYGFSAPVAATIDR
ncbi:MAG: DUF1571 domain-containing protein, partial [Pirellulales bacterium]|nr:DUF1571 domain-containing protein [Pirellulales bacterium]